MEPVTRRKFVRDGGKAAAAGALLLSPARPAASRDQAAPLPAPPARTDPVTLSAPLDGAWSFRLDPSGGGEAAGWFRTGAPGPGWSPVTVPHTWQTSEDSADYQGFAWYAREFDLPADWAGRSVRVEFEAVYHTARVWVNGVEGGAHAGRGYTAFDIDITRLVRFGDRNAIAVRVDNSFSPDMLPRGNSCDWAMDGGVTRLVRLLADPPVAIAGAWIDALPSPGHLPGAPVADATLEITAEIRNSSPGAAEVELSFAIVDDASGLSVLDVPAAGRVTIPGGDVVKTRLRPAALPGARLWHFDAPNLYRLRVRASRPGGGALLHETETTFGVRRIEARDGGFYLNGERVRLMGVERMAGSHPSFGMAEPSSWIDHDHDDMKNLNCVFTRVHWPQDRRVLDYCDRHGILIQTEVPSWGGDTFKGMTAEPAPAILENGLAQLREMVRRDRNHPCVVSWGLCNEVDGHNPPAREFVRAMAREARRLDPRRLVSYASNSLQATPGLDVAGEMDFIEWNEYYESWYGGTPETMRRNLEEIHAAFPDKAVVISEYGYCACTSDRPEGDARRIGILKSHDAVFRDYPWVSGLIFFDYNDYRTHIGDKGRGVLKQRVHGVVDVFGTRKPSYDVLRRESSPVESVALRRGDGGQIVAAIRARATVPSYTLRGYAARWLVYGDAGIPVETHQAALADLPPGASIEVSYRPGTAAARRVRLDVMRPTGFSAADAELILKD